MRRFSLLPALLLPAMLLAGCDKLTGAADQKIADAEAIGFACRVSSKTPEECMKENEAQSPSSILDGWKSADEDIKAGKLDPGMKNVAAPAAEGGEGAAAAEGEAKPGAEAAPADTQQDPKKGEAEAKKPEAKDAAAKDQEKPKEDQAKR